MTKTKILETLKSLKLSKNELAFDILEFSFTNFEDYNKIINQKLELCDYLMISLKNFEDKKSVFMIKHILGLKVEIIKSLLNSNFSNKKDNLIKKWKRQFNFYYE